MTSIIRTIGLVKEFGAVRALDGLDLDVAEGQVHGFLGPNGAGKTTTIRTLLGLLRPTAGRVEVFGRSPWTNATELHRRLAYVPGDVNLWPNLTGGEVIDLMSALNGTRDRQRRDELVERFELDPRKRCRTYSKGNRQKVVLVAALASGTELLILDEPTSGLDPLMEERFREVVSDERTRGRTVLLSSHILSEVEALCDWVTIVRAGRSVESAPLDHLRGAQQTSVTADLASAPGRLDAIPGVHDVEIAGTHVSCRVDPDHLDELLRRLSSLGVRSLRSTPPSLEQLFLAHYRQAPDPDPEGLVSDGALEVRR